MTSIDFDVLIDNYLHRESKPKQIGRYWPSDTGGCIRKTYFSFKIPKVTEKDVRRVFEAGNRLHEFIGDVINSEKNSGVKLLERELPIKINCDDFVISGRIDDLVLVNFDGQKYLIEVKSAKFLPKEAREEHIGQIQLYMHSLGVVKGILLYVQKDDLQTKQFEISYDKESVDKVIAKFRKLHSHLIWNEIPEAEARIIPEKNWMCGYCQWNQECERYGGY